MTQTSNHEWDIPTVGADEGSWGEVLNSFFDGELDEEVVLKGPFSERPTAGEDIVDLYLAIDRRIVYYNDGNSWEAVYGLGNENNPVPNTSYFESASVESEPTADTDVVRKLEADEKADLPIETDDLSDEAVTTAKIAAAAVDSEAISDGAVGVSELAEALGTDPQNPISGTTHLDSVSAEGVSGDTISAKQNIQNQNGTYIENVETDSVSGLVTVDVTDGALFNHTVTDDVDYTFANPDVDFEGLSFTLFVDMSGSNAIDWPESVSWSGNSNPDTPPDGEQLEVSFLSYDGGETWKGRVGWRSQ